MKGLRSTEAAAGSSDAALSPMATTSPSASPSVISVSSPLDAPALTVRGTSVSPFFTHNSRLPVWAGALYPSTVIPMRDSSSASGTKRSALVGTASACSFSSV